MKYFIGILVGGFIWWIFRHSPLLMILAIVIAAVIFAIIEEIFASNRKQNIEKRGNCSNRNYLLNISFQNATNDGKLKSNPPAGWPDPKMLRPVCKPPALETDMTPVDWSKTNPWDKEY